MLCLRFFKNSFVVIAVCFVFLASGCFGNKPESTIVFEPDNNEMLLQNESTDESNVSINTDKVANDKIVGTTVDVTEIFETDTVNQEEQQTDNNIHTINIELPPPAEIAELDLESVEIEYEESSTEQTVEFVIGEAVVIPVNDITESDEYEPSYEDSPVVFSDAKFESIVRKFLGKPEGEILQSSLASIKYADVFMGLSFSYSANPSRDEKILIKMNEEDYPSSFDDVKYFTGLEYLSIPFIPVVDLTFLSSMTNLKYLYMYRASLSDLSPLSNLKNMEELNLVDCGIKDINVLANLPALKKLDLSENTSIDNYSALKGLESLETLKLSGNEINNIDFVAELESVLELDLSKNNISNTAPLSNLKNINSLNLNKNSISDVSPLSQLSNLKKLYLTGNPVSDINALGDISGFSTLKYDN